MIINKLQPLRIVFMGTPMFALPSLKMLYDGKYQIEAIITQPDKPKGRGNHLGISPVKEYALEKNIPVLQPITIKHNEEFNQSLKDINPNLIIVIAYGKILPAFIIDLPEYGCINLHSSLLPKYRGAAPINWAIINGEEISGVTTMMIDTEMDTGDILLNSKVTITSDMTAGELHDKLAVMGAETLRQTLIQLQNNSLKPVHQAGNVSYAPMLTKEMGHINWDQTALTLHNLIRGITPVPGAYTFYQGNRLRVWKSKPILESTSGNSPGEIKHVSKDGILITCNGGSLLIEQIQPESGKQMSVDEFLRGHKISVGEFFG